jgi:tetratricopeptide (TPR) repeat protein
MDQQVESGSGSFVADMAGIVVSGAKGKRSLGRDKSSVLSDIQLAHSELDQAAAVDPGVTLHVEGVDVGIPNLRAALFRINGVVEMTLGTAERAKQMLVQSSDLVEDSYTHFLLGSLYESEYKPQDALKQFERCLELDPNGENSVEALRAANAMRTYKKKFRGNWLLLVFLFCCYIVPGVIYWRKKYK